MTATSNSEVHLDWMCIGLRKLSELDRYVVYEFSSNRYRDDGDGRSTPLSPAYGKLRLDKALGKIEVMEPMEGDGERRIAIRAASKVASHWKRGELPTTSMYASG